MNDLEMLAIYQDVLGISSEMADAARQNEWDKLVELEVQRAGLMQKMMDSEAIELPDEMAEKVAGIIRRTLELDAETKELTQLWMGELTQIINSVDAEKKLNNVYVGNE